MSSPRAHNKFFRKLNRFSFRLIKGKINFHARHNSFYNDEQILQTLVFLSIRNRYPENGCKRYREMVKNAPDADTFYRRLRKKSMQECLEEFMNIQKEILHEIRKRTRKRRIIVFIDEHERPWFGEPNQYVIGTNNFDGTNICFKYITINALIDKYKICLFALPITPFSRKDKLVDELLSKTEKLVTIGLVLFDRGFSKDSKILKVVEKHRLKYLAPMEKRNRVKRIANFGDGVNSFSHTDHEFGKERIKTNLFFIPNGKRGRDKWESYHVFCTNIEVTKANLNHLAELYGKRWNIENFYRDTENNFMVKTKTPDFATRYFFFLFTSLLYNLWYFVRGFFPLIAEAWKDLIEDEVRKQNDGDIMDAMLTEMLQMKTFYFSFLSSYNIIVLSILKRKIAILNVL